MNATLPTGTVPARGRSHANQVRTPCWCGQDLEHVRRSHCPRCGRSTAPRTIR